MVARALTAEQPSKRPVLIQSVVRIRSAQYRRGARLPSARREQRRVGLRGVRLVGDDEVASDLRTAGVETLRDELVEGHPIGAGHLRFTRLERRVKVVEATLRHVGAKILHRRRLQLSS